MWERILVPLDGSNLAELALPYAEEIAAAFNSEVVLLYVSESGESEYRHMHQLYIEGVAKQMREHIKEHRPDVVRAIVLPGEPAEQIIDYAWRHKVGLIIMASHGRSGIMPWAMGSVANKVLNATRVPVLLIKVVKPPQRVPGKHLLNRILLPLDGSKAGEAAVPYILELSDRLESEVILLGMVPAGEHVRTVGGLDYILYPEQDLELVKAEAREYLDKVYHRLVGRKGVVRVELKVGGDVAQEIIKFAEKANASLIAISAHGRSGIGKWVFGSITLKVLHASNTPILVVRVARGKT
jgi:nucleotide-binding universal stress UspA family protein